MAEQCTAILSNGERCKQPALKGFDKCRHHSGMKGEKWLKNPGSILGKYRHGLYAKLLPKLEAEIYKETQDADLAAEGARLLAAKLGAYMAMQRDRVMRGEEDLSNDAEVMELLSRVAHRMGSLQKMSKEMQEGKLSGSNTVNVAIIWGGEGGAGMPPAVMARVEEVKGELGDGSDDGVVEGEVLSKAPGAEEVGEMVKEVEKRPVKRKRRKPRSRGVGGVRKRQRDMAVGLDPRVVARTAKRAV